MNPILKDSLVLKYFGCAHVHGYVHDCEGQVALRVLDAMTAKIELGDKFLRIADDGSTELSNDFLCGSPIDIHPWKLRLPQEHQEPDYEKELAEKRRLWAPGSWACHLDVMIDLARKAERQKMERAKR